MQIDSGATMRFPQIPGIEIIPLFGSKKPYSWTTKDFSKLDWTADYIDQKQGINPDTSKPYNKFNRGKPSGYGVRGGKSLVILDLDEKQPGMAEDILTKLQSQGLDTNTFTVKTKSGGLHLYYLAPDYPVASPTNWRYEGLDLRGQGGFVVGPDMEARDWCEGRYVVINDTLPIKCGLDLPVRETKTYNNIPASLTDETRNAKYYFEMIKSEGFIPLGNRDHACFQIAEHWVREGLSDEEIIQRFMELPIAQPKGNEYTLEDFMIKVERCRGKEKDFLSVYIRQFAMLADSGEVYDFGKKIRHPLSRMKDIYPEKVGKAHIMDLWNRSPDRKTYSDIGFKPIYDETYKEGHKIYVNTYSPPVIEPWSEEVSWEDEDLEEFRLIAENLITDPLALDYYLSQRAKKIQNPMWTPAWGFVIISGRRMGKGILWSAYSKLIGAEYSISLTNEIIEDKFNKWKEGSLLTKLDEPDNLKSPYSQRRFGELLKIYYSEREGSTRAMRKDLSGLKKYYYIPETHANIANALQIHSDEGRYCIIKCSNKALGDEIYNELGEKILGFEQGEERSVRFMRKLKRFLLDYKPNKDIKVATAPKTIWHQNIVELSSDQEELMLLDAIENSTMISYSDIQTIESIMKILQYDCNIQRINTNRTLEIVNELVKKGKIVKYRRVEGVPHIDILRATSTEPMIVNKSLASGRHSPVLYSIRNHDNYKNAKAKELRENFFPFNSQI